MILIKNARILTCADKDFDNGYIIIEETKISAIGNMAEIKTDESEFEKVIDAGGRFVFPGFVEGHCHIGLWEEGTSEGENDGNETTDPITPHLCAFDAVNPCDKAFHDAKCAGITTVVTGPGSANLIGGTFCAMKTDGVCVDDMVVKKNAAMKFAFGENPKHTHGESSAETRMAAAAMIREILEKAKKYNEKKKAADEGEGDAPEYDVKLEALIPVLEGQLPVKAHAHRASDIFTALRIQKEFNLKMTIEHCSDGLLIKDKLSKKGISGVLAGPVSTTRSKPELLGYDMCLASALLKCGILTGLVTDYPEEPLCYLPVSAALMQKYGIGEDEALRMITIYPAQLCGIESRVGSLEAGKDADIVISAHHPLDITGKIDTVIINGKIVKD